MTAPQVFRDAPPLHSGSFRHVVRNYAIPLAAFGSVFLLPAEWFLAGFLIIGQAHFAITFLYQYRAGKIRRGYLAIGGILVVLLALYFIVQGTFLPIFILTAVLFAAHFAHDEFTLHKEESAPGKVFAVTLFTGLFLSLILYALFPSLVSVAIVAGLLFTVSLIVRVVGHTSALSVSEQYIWLVGSLLLILALGFGIRPEVLLSIIIIFHCVNWYLDYGKRIAERNEPAKLRRYWLEVAATLSVSFALYGLYSFYELPFLQFAFLPMYYDAWALAHFALTSKFLTTRV